ncbi:MAG: DapH/DapD/GlmU-related protein, partial [Candidatus Electrothrix sp.]
DCQVGQDCVVQAGVQITGSAKIGSRVLVGSGAVLHNCQVGDKAVIGANSVLKNCTVQEGAQIPPLTSRLS